ncbi:MAG: ABC transporter permease, partial [Gemmatimonadota bacterium]
MSTPASEKPSPGQRYLRLLLRRLPFGFRARHETELLDVLAEMRAELGPRPGPLRLLRFYFDATSDVIRQSRIQRQKQWPPRKSSSFPRASVSRWLLELRHDAVYGVRSLARTKTFTIIAVLSLALGIGVNTGLFTFVNTTLKPVPGVTGADRVVEILGTNRGREMEVWSYPDFRDVRETTIPIQLTGWKQRDGNLTTEQGGERVWVMYVSANYFEVLGVTPAIGRDFSPSDDVSPGQ